MNKTVNIPLNIDSINEMIKSSYVEGSDVSDLMINNEKDLQEFVNHAIENLIFPPVDTNEAVAFSLGLHYGKKK